MSRYTILLKKPPEEILKAKFEKIVPFGFDQDITVKKKRTFFQGAGEKPLLMGIVFSDPQTMFFGSKVHFHDRHKFFCKSTPDRKALCCTRSYSGYTPQLRIATIIAEYPKDSLQRLLSTNMPQIIPWVFGKTVYNNLDEYNKTFSLKEHDFFVKRETNTLYPSYTILPHFDKGSLWQESPMKDRILEIYNQLSRDIKSYIADDLDEDEINRIINNSSSGESTRQFPLSAREIRSRSLRARLVGEEDDEAGLPMPTSGQNLDPTRGLNLDDLFSDSD